ncbi:MAG: ABC transporter permease [Aquabacterium sp.]|uniref:ABC transporter permease n=1 Tax=Aquabacterium sp. TaxID=1872578 RepID=UPI0011F7445B|nr:ABC transporter permease [Aquabacterium sp.]TAK90332.1 MAG: ABC transporter permease [Aquabacterium sp.]
MSDTNTRSTKRQYDWRGLVLPVAFIALWYALTSLKLVNTKLIVPPAGVVTTGIKELGNPDFYIGIGLSLWRDLSGFALGALAGVTVGALIGVSRLADKIIGPTFHTARQISLFAWLPLLSAMVGTGELSKVIFIGFSAFYPVVLGTLEGVRGVTSGQAEVAKVYGFTRQQLLTKLILPAASPQILSGLRLGLIYAWLATIGAEFLLVDDGQGLGNTVFKGRMAFNVELILFGLLAIALIGNTFNRLADRAEKRLLRWRAPTAR